MVEINGTCIFAVIGAIGKGWVRFSTSARFEVSCD